MTPLMKRIGEYQMLSRCQMLTNSRQIAIGAECSAQSETPQISCLQLLPTRCIALSRFKLDLQSTEEIGQMPKKGMKSALDLKSTELVFLSRKESVTVRTSSSTSLTPQIQQSTTSVDCPCHDEIWIPRAQKFLLFLYLIIDCRIEISLPNVSAVTEAVSHYVERAEVSQKPFTAMC